MSKLYYLDNVASDLSDGGLFNNRLVEASPGTSTITVSLSGNQTLTAFGYTIAGEPGIIGATGDYNFAIQIVTTNVQGRVSFQVRRINSTGTVQASSAATAEQSTGASRTATLTGVNLGTWNAGDRLRLDYIFRNNQNMPQSFSISTGLGTSVEAPFVAPVTARYFFFT